MSDYLGPNQTRVLDSENRNFESVIYQKRKPPLSSEVNLGGKVDTDRNQLAMKYLIPSGWSFVSQIQDNIAASLCQSGAVICSPTLSRNSIKFVALDKGQDVQKNVAWINGWRVLVQGTNSSDEDNIIILPEPPTIGSRVDFVFLEVWRKLVYPSDTIFKHGNVLYGGTNYSNDLIDPAMGIETSLRIQLQYRIRVSPSDIESYPDGFDPNLVFVQGPLPEPISTSSHSYFSPVAGDPGLWYAGNGDDVSQEVLGTVDGYTYAIPLFAVRRRNTSSYLPDSRSNGASKSLTDYKAGLASDRPDNLYNDWIVAEDILDMRHKVIPQENVRELCEDAFDRLINNKLPGKMTKVSLGEDSFGISLVQPDAISNLDKPGSTRIAQGDGIRRIFSNAQLDQPESFSVRTVAQKTAGTPNIPWASGDSVQISLAGYPTGTQLVGLKEVFAKQVGVLAPTQYTTTTIPTSGTLTITLGPSALVLGSAYPLTFEYTLRYASGANGLTQVPSMFLECRNEDSSASIAMRDIDIPVRTAVPIGTSDGTKFPMLMNRGGSITEPYDFGHQMVFHAVGNGTQIFTVPRSMNGYDILGIVSIKVSGQLRTSPTITRSATTYTVDVGSPSIAVGRDIEVVLYTENKIFDANKQGRAITDCWEMMELTPDETADGGRRVFHIDTVDKAVLALASYAGDNGAGFAYVNGTRKVLETVNKEFPYDSTKTYGTVTFSSPDTPASGSVIEVPTFMHSAISAAEGYTFFYKTLPYQGLLDSSATGVVEAAGSAITTSSGSGSIMDYQYTTGLARLTDTTVVYGTGTEWMNYVKPGQIIRRNSDATREYAIKEVYNNTTMFLNVIPDKTSVVAEAYAVISKDQPQFLQRNIIDLLPTYNSLNDSSAKNVSIATACVDSYPIIETRIVSKVQDITTMPPNTVWVGMNAADRGRSAVHINSEELAPIGLGNLGLKFEKLTSSGTYTKTFQSYILNKNNSGQLYLLVVGSETDNTSASCIFNPASNMDSVDIFELPGRPLVMRRIA